MVGLLSNSIIVFLKKTAGEMDFKVEGALEHWKVLSANMVGRQEKIWILDAQEWLKQ